MPPALRHPRVPWQMRARALQGGAEGRDRHRERSRSGGAAPGAECRSLRSEPRERSSLQTAWEQILSERGRELSGKYPSNTSRNPKHPDNFRQIFSRNLYHHYDKVVLFWLKREVREMKHDRNCQRGLIIFKG